MLVLQKFFWLRKNYVKIIWMGQMNLYKFVELKNRPFAFKFFVSRIVFSNVFSSIFFVLLFVVSLLKLKYFWLKFCWSITNFGLLITEMLCVKNWLVKIIIGWSKLLLK